MLEITYPFDIQFAKFKVVGDFISCKYLADMYNKQKHSKESTAFVWDLNNNIVVYPLGNSNDSI